MLRQRALMEASDFRLSALSGVKPWMRRPGKRTSSAPIAGDLSGDWNLAFTIARR